MNVLLVLDQEYLLPSVAPKLARERDDVEGARSYGLGCIRDGDSRLLSAQQFAPKQERIRGLTIMELVRDGNRPTRMGDVITATKAGWDRKRHGWSLEGGIRIKVAEAIAGGITSEAEVTRERIDFYPCELPPEELLARQKAQWVKFLSVRQLNQLQGRNDVNLTEIARIKHGRFTLPVNNMILLVLGITFFMTRVPGSVLTQGAKALGVCALAFLVTFIGQQLVGSAAVSPALPAWLPIFLFGPVAALLMENVKT
jgi:lipopolysaccharide export LptBFGC system permease protein LptF